MWTPRANPHHWGRVKVRGGQTQAGALTQGLHEVEVMAEVREAPGGGAGLRGRQGRR